MTPDPSVSEGLDLGRRVVAVPFLEQDVVRPIGVEWRVEIDQIDTFVRKVLTHDFQVVAVVELVRLRRRCSSPGHGESLPEDDPLRIDRSKAKVAGAGSLCSQACHRLKAARRMIPLQKGALRSQAEGSGAPLSRAGRRGSLWSTALAAWLRPGGGAARHTRAWSVGAPAVVADCRQLRFVPQPCQMQGSVMVNTGALRSSSRPLPRPAKPQLRSEITQPLSKSG